MKPNQNTKQRVEVVRSLLVDLLQGLLRMDGCSSHLISQSIKKRGRLSEEEGLEEGVEEGSGLNGNQGRGE